MADQLLTLPEVAERLRVSPRSVRRLTSRREIDVVRIGRRVLVPHDAVSTFVAERREAHAGGR